MDEEEVEPSVVRARSLEIVDDAGHVRAVLGLASSGEGEAPGAVGLRLFDVDGRTRLWLALDSTGPSLAIDLGGNLGVHLGVTDPAHDVTEAAVYLVLADGSGTARRGWRVAEDGSVRAWARE